MLTKLFAYVPSITGSLLIFALVALNNHKSKLNRLFLLLSGLATFWIGSLFIADTTSSPNIALQTVRLGVAISTLTGPVFLLFSRNFPHEHAKPLSPSAKALLLAPAVLLAFVAFTPIMIQSIAITQNGAQLGNSTFLYTVDTVMLAGYFAAGTYGLIRKRRYSQLIEKRQIDFVLLGILIVFITNLITNYILPLFGFHGGANLIGSSSIFIFSAIAAYAILKHRLFDIRFLVARSFAYVFSLGTLGIAFTVVAFGAPSVFLGSNNLNTVSARWLYTALAIVLALLFPSLKRFFDKVTNRLFFRDSYDTQVFFDEFNQTLVATYELDELLKESVKIIGQNIKPAHCQFIINKTANTDERVMGTANRPTLDGKDLKTIEEAVNKTRRKLIVADELETGHEALQKHLRAKNIVLAAALTSSSSGRRTEVGYLLLGPKKSGNLYSSQDTKVLEIVANELVIAVQNALRFEEIESFNITLQAKVDEATKKLRRANEKLKALDETKDDFISMASHQLRTPLTSVKGYISMILEGDTGKISSKQKEMLGQAFFSSQRMVYLIADLLNVSRLRTGKFVIEPAPVNLADVVDEELGQLEETAASHELKLKYDKPKKFPELMLDETKTRQVIMNFVDNAIYYTPSGGHINVRLIDNPTTVELKVEDDGIGVPVSEKPHMFTKFYRAGNARKARPDGTGLGLFMAKKVVVGQGGSIIFESQEGKGSTFGFIFSKAKHTVPAK